MRAALFILVFLFSLDVHAGIVPLFGFNLTENGGDFIYDASPDETKVTAAQERVLQAKALGAKHIVINLRAKMIGGRSNEIIPVTPPAERSKETARLVRLIRFIKQQGLSCGLRPIFFVVGPNGEFPYREKLADGTTKLWWHGNIQPRNPDIWFESFRTYLDLYIRPAIIAKADEFTIGAELYSMTVGIEDQWKEFPYGFPGRWLELLRYVRHQLPQARLMYDINFTDDTVNAGELRKAGGEIERWRYRLVDLADQQDPEQAAIHKDLVAFWSELDAVGIDMYRSLASPGDQLPAGIVPLTETLKRRTDAYAAQLDTILGSIPAFLEGVKEKPIYLKEVGYRSVENGMINPFEYAGSGSYNEVHQAAAYSALFKSFWEPNWQWFAGIILWELPLDPAKSGKGDIGFSPLGKPMSEEVLGKYK